MKAIHKRLVDSRKYRVAACRICKSSNITPFLSLGTMPIPNGFVKKEDLKKQEFYYPLQVGVCENCHLVQLMHIIPAEVMFRNYLYIPSTSTTHLKHFEMIVAETTEKAKLKKSDLVVDIGSNDGALLSFFKAQGMKVLGVDPAINLAKLAIKKGIPTVNEFFTEDHVSRLETLHGKARAITATNVFAHIDDLHDVCAGLKIWLAEDGLFVFESPYLVDLLEQNEFDTIYHEHLSYLAITPLQQLFKQYGLQIVDVVRDPIHGGSIRVSVAHTKSNYKVQKSVSDLVTLEKKLQLDTMTPYESFASRVKTIKKKLRSHLLKLRKQGKRIIGYGASAKGNVLLNYCEITTDILEYIVDSISYKQGKYTPGTHILIHPEKKLLKDTPDYALLLSWNFAEEIIKKQESYTKRGGKFIVMVPEIHIKD